MPIKLKLTFELDKHIGFPPPSVRVWVDTDKNLQLTSAEEVGLAQDGLKWTGERDLEIGSTDGLKFFTAYVASVGARWKLSVQSDTPTLHTVCEEQGTSHTGNDAFWGGMSQ